MYLALHGGLLLDIRCVPLPPRSLKVRKFLWPSWRNAANFAPVSSCKGSECKIFTFQIQHNANDDISDSLPPPPPPPPGEQLSPSPCPPHHHQQQMQQQMQQQQLGMTMCTSPRPPQNRQVAIIHNPEVQVRSLVMSKLSSHSSSPNRIFAEQEGRDIALT